nr:unnamed protein product [Digitaria exilis]
MHEATEPATDTAHDAGKSLAGNTSSSQGGTAQDAEPVAQEDASVEADMPVLTLLENHDEDTTGLVPDATGQEHAVPELEDVGSELPADSPTHEPLPTGLVEETAPEQAADQAEDALTAPNAQALLDVSPMRVTIPASLLVAADLDESPVRDPSPAPLPIAGGLDAEAGATETAPGKLAAAPLIVSAVRALPAPLPVAAEATGTAPGQLAAAPARGVAVNTAITNEPATRREKTGSQLPVYKKTWGDMGGAKKPRRSERNAGKDDHTLAKAEIMAARRNLESPALDAASGKVGRQSHGDSLPTSGKAHGLTATMLALIALKKGTQLLKYGRKGKPKFTPFRLSNAEVFTWGEECSGRLGHGVGTNVFQPRLVESLSICNVELIACGEFHTCAVTATGDLYTWGDGTHNAGLLGHGSNVSHWIPKRVSGPLDGLQSNASSGKLFTWGDGDKYRLGHGHIFTVGSSVYGQLGNPNNDGRYPRLVEEKLGGGGVVEVACGSYHVAVLTNAGEVYTWGKGANGRLGHGDVADRKVPTVVEALRDSYSKNTIPRLPGDTKNEKIDTKAAKVAPSSSSDMIRNLDVKAAKQTKKYDYSSQIPGALQLKDIPFISATDLQNSSLSSESLESLRDANEFLKQEVQKLQAEVNSLKQEREQKNTELQKSEAKAHEAMILATEEASKLKTAKDVIKSLTAQLKEMSERLPPGACDVKNGRMIGALPPETGRDNQMRNDPGSIQYPQTPASVASARFGGLPAQVHQASEYNGTVVVPQDGRGEHLSGFREFSAQQRANGGTIGYRHRADDHDRKETDRFQINLNNLNLRSSGSPNNQVEAEWIEQYEPDSSFSP